MYLTAFNSVQLDPCRQLLSTEPSFKIQSSLSHLKNLIVYLRYLTAKWQAQIASNPRTSFLSMWCRLNLEFPFHDSTPRVRDLAWSAILKKNRDCAERSEVRESRTVKLEPASASDRELWPVPIRSRHWLVRWEHNKNDNRKKSEENGRRDSIFCLPYLQQIYY